MCCRPRAHRLARSCWSTHGIAEPDRVHSASGRTMPRWPSLSALFSHDDARRITMAENITTVHWHVRHGRSAHHGPLATVASEGKSDDTTFRAIGATWASSGHTCTSSSRWCGSRNPSDKAENFGALSIVLLLSRPEPRLDRQFLALQGPSLGPTLYAGIGIASVFISVFATWTKTGK